MTHRVQPDLVARRRKRRSLLAGGAVLGLGAVATLAAWSDDVWVLSSFSTDPFLVEAQLSPTAEWEQFQTAPGGDLTFQVEPTAMLPSDSVYAPLNLRIARGDSPGVVSLPAAPATGPLSGNDANLFNALTLTLYAVGADDCDAVGTAAAPPVDGFSGAPTLPTATGEDLLTLPPAGESGPGDAVGLCFKVTLPADVGPGVAGGAIDQLVWNLKVDPVDSP